MPQLEKSPPEQQWKPSITKNQPELVKSARVVQVTVNHDPSRCTSAFGSPCFSSLFLTLYISTLLVWVGWTKMRPLYSTSFLLSWWGKVILAGKFLPSAEQFWLWGWGDEVDEVEKWSCLFFFSYAVILRVFYFSVLLKFLSSSPRAVFICG